MVSLRIYISIVLTVLVLNQTITQSSTLRVGVVAYKSHESIEKAYEPLMGYVSKKLGKELKLTVTEYDVYYGANSTTYVNPNGTT